jgi:predicted outer membrane repeat protein
MKRKFARFSMIVISALVLASLGTPQAALAATGPLCYVDTDATGDNDGNSWANAYTKLEYALEDANCTEIWVAEGIYKPGTDPSENFMIHAGEQVYGGFAGTETSLSQRDWNTHLTILSGDIDNDDAVDFYGITQLYTYIAGSNSTNIVWVDGIASPVLSGTRLDGFIITGGESNLPSPAESLGGGLYCSGGGSGHECSPTLEHLRFYGNYAKDGGGAIFNDGRSGGESSPILQHVTFSGNYAIGGGALVNFGDAGTTETTINYATFSGNSALYGGAIYTQGYNTVSTNVQINQSLFKQNTASSSGGAIYNGGYMGNCFTSINRVTFYQNTATQYGGAIFNDGSYGICSPGLTGVTFSGNSANMGGGIYNDGTGGTSGPTLRSILMWGDTAVGGGPEIYNSFGNPGITYSDIQGSGGSGAGWDSSVGSDIGNNIDSNPLLSGLADNGGETETMALKWGSPAIDTGEDGTCQADDQRGVHRPQGNHCDMGALERVFPRVRADFESDGISDIGTFHPATGVWSILESSENFSYAAPRYYSWGQTGDILALGDYDGDGRMDPTVRRPPAGGESAAYRILLSTTGYNFGSSLTVPAGWPGIGDTPVPGDYNGDGKSDPAIWRGSAGVWIIPMSPAFSTYQFFSWGATGDTPVAADVDGDLQSDIGYWRPSTGVWGFLQSTYGYSYANPVFFNWGTSGDITVMADYDGDDLADPAVVIPPASGQSQAYRILLSTQSYNPAMSVTIPAGWPGLGDTPVPADYDGDGIADAAIWRASAGVWIIPKSSTGNISYMFAAWGAAGDVPAR